MDFHEAAMIFPLDDGPELAALADDIEQNGLQIPVETLDGKIIDGRRRWLACEQKGIEPDVLEVEVDDPVAYVVSLNLRRRHLDQSQKSMVGARIKEFYAKQAKGRRKATLKRGSHQPVPANLPDREKGDARDQAGDASGASGRSVDHASRVLADGSKGLQRAVDSGKIPVSSAAKLTNLSKAEQSRIAKSENPAAEARKAAKSQKPPPDYADILADAFRELSDRIDSIVDQYGSLTKMFKSEAWQDCDCRYVIEMIHELRTLFVKLDTEAQKHAKTKGTNKKPPRAKGA